MSTDPPFRGMSSFLRVFNQNINIYREVYEQNTYDDGYITENPAKELIINIEGTIVPTGTNYSKPNEIGVDIDADAVLHVNPLELQVYESFRTDPSTRGWIQTTPGVLDWSAGEFAIGGEFNTANHRHVLPITEIADTDNWEATLYFKTEVQSPMQFAHMGLFNNTQNFNKSSCTISVYDNKAIIHISADDGTLYSGIDIIISNDMEYKGVMSYNSTTRVLTLNIYLNDVLVGTDTITLGAAKTLTLNQLGVMTHTTVVIPYYKAWLTKVEYQDTVQFVSLKIGDIVSCPEPILHNVEYRIVKIEYYTYVWLAWLKRLEAVV